MKTYSFIDYENQDFVKYNNGKIVKIKSSSRESVMEDFCSDGRIYGKTDWTNSGTVIWCWEDME